MDIQSLSGIVLIAIALVVLVGVIPSRTMKSLRNASRHLEDKYSTSLRVLDNDDAYVRDELRAVMPVNGKIRDVKRFHPRNVQRVREQRKRGIRNRQILVALLTVGTLATVAGAYVLHFTYWFTAIPGALLGIVLILGVRTSRAAVQWEKEFEDFKKQCEQEALFSVTTYVDTPQAQSATVGKEAEETTEHQTVPSQPLFAVDTVKTIEFETVKHQLSTHAAPLHGVTSTVRVAEDDVHSREIKSTKQVSVAVPPQYDVFIPASDTAAGTRSKSDLTPSARPQATVARNTVQSHAQTRPLIQSAADTQAPGKNKQTKKQLPRTLVQPAPVRNVPAQDAATQKSTAQDFADTSAESQKKPASSDLHGSQLSVESIFEMRRQ
ncbi:hypothetical protein [Alloscardovia criceti]|uniref:hypothetical protein n=1 Tax=Alloscardovia criceti TaxID=356828 RepID=UPI00037AFD92|nr:hypothetical protein [Alloscardovia criceti]